MDGWQVNSQVVRITFPHFVEEAVKRLRLCRTESENDAIQLAVLLVELFQQCRAFLCQYHIYQALVCRADLLLNKAFFEETFHYPACITHFVEHPFADLERTHRFVAAPEDAKDIVLL